MFSGDPESTFDYAKKIVEVESRSPKQRFPSPSSDLSDTLNQQRDEAGKHIKVKLDYLFISEKEIKSQHIRSTSAYNNTLNKTHFLSDQQQLSSNERTIDLVSDRSKTQVGKVIKYGKFFN